MEFDVSFAIFPLHLTMLFFYGGLTICVTCGWAGVDKTLRAGNVRGVEKCLKMRAESHPSSARFVGRTCYRMGVGSKENGAVERSSGQSHFGSDALYLQI